MFCTTFERTKVKFENRHGSIREVARHLDISRKSVRLIFEGMFGLKCCGVMGGQFRYLSSPPCILKTVRKFRNSIILKNSSKKIWKNMMVVISCVLHIYILIKFNKYEIFILSRRFYYIFMISCGFERSTNLYALYVSFRFWKNEIHLICFLWQLFDILCPKLCSSLASIS